MTDITQGLPTEVQDAIGTSSPTQRHEAEMEKLLPSPQWTPGAGPVQRDSGVGRVPPPQPEQVPMRPADQAPDIDGTDMLSSMFFKHMLDKDRAASGLPPLGAEAGPARPQEPAPGSFASKLAGAVSGVGGAVANAMGDAAAGSQAKGGWLSAVAATSAARNERMEREKQAEFERTERKRMDDVNYAHSQISTLQAQQALRHAENEEKKSTLEYNNAMADSLDQVGAKVVQRNMTGDQVQKWMQDPQNAELRNSVTSVTDHFLPPDKNGYEQPVYNLYGAVPAEVHLSPKIAELLTKFGTTGDKYEAGSTYQGSGYVRAVNSALSNQAAQLARDKVISETYKNNEEAKKAALAVDDNKEHNQIAAEIGPTMTHFGWAPLDALDAAQSVLKDPKASAEDKAKATDFSEKVMKFFKPDVIAAERAKQADRELQRMKNVNDRADRKLDKMQEAGTNLLMKSTEKFGDFSRQIGTMMGNINRAQSGDELANSMEPLFAALNIATSAGVHRINQTEIDQAGARVGSLYRRWNNLIDKAMTGTMDPAMYKEAADLANSLQTVAYDKYVGTQLINMKNNHLPEDTLIYGSDGHQSITLGDAKKQREQRDREDYAASTGQAPKDAPTFNNGTVYRGTDGKYYVTATGQPYVPQQPQPRQ